MPDGMKDIEYYREKFDELSREAREFGISVVVVMESNDPIAMQTQVARISNGSPVTTVGLLQMALMEHYPRA